MSPPRRALLSLAAVALVQTAVLGYMVFDRMRLIKSGREIVLPIVPVDPRDLFRGEYVRLSYPVTQVTLPSADASPIRANDTVYVVLEKAADDEWRPVEVARTRRTQGGPDRIVMKARVQWASPVNEKDDATTRTASVRYGIESYFVPQGEGLRLETLARERKLAALIAVGGDGTAAIKGLIIDGKLQYEEPLL